MAQPKEKKKQPPFDQKLNEVHALESEISTVVQKLERKIWQFEQLNAFSALLNSTLDTYEVREKALEATCKLLSCETASLLLVDPKTQELYWENALGEVGKKLERNVRLPINEKSLAGYTALKKEQLLVNDVASDPRHFKKVGKKDGKKSEFVTRNMLSVPLEVKGQVIGVLQALNKLPLLGDDRRNKSDFYEEDLQLMVNLSHQVAIAVDNSQLYEKLKKSFVETVEALVEALEQKDHYTGGHTKRVVHYSLSIAAQMNLSREEIEEIRLGAILHDVGKIGIEDKILKKASPLDEYEWPVMKKHPEIGYHIMKKVEGLKDVIAGMRYHHERWDGKGYPEGLAGEEIPLIARIIAVGDTWDAMVSTRPYRKGMDPEVAFEEIIRHRGTQFCPHVVEAFEKAFLEGKMGRRSKKKSKQS